jgi:DNA-binding MarR family transcriptional regulator/GNAT superfamily N-acetyltransferase
MRQLIESVRRFNRFYTRQIGAFNSRFLGSPYSLTEVRVLYELAHRDGLTASDLTAELGLDPGYLSRMLAGFQRRGLVRRQPSSADARRAELSLTPRGRRDFGRWENRQRDDVRAMLAGIAPDERARVVQAMRSLERALGAPDAMPRDEITLRDLRPGDVGWITHRQAILYHEEYGWDMTYEALIAEIMGKFVRTFDPRYEKVWVAERDGEIVGSVFCVRRSRTVAQLRLLYVEPSIRGAGLGSRLVDECIAFARQAGYKRMMLWTNSVLHAARRIYERAGFELVESERHPLFGKMLTSQTWERAL